MDVEISAKDLWKMARGAIVMAVMGAFAVKQAGEIWRGESSVIFLAITLFIWLLGFVIFRDAIMARKLVPFKNEKTEDKPHEPTV